ncbi:LysR family transcriptional regulator ArgP [Isoptericola halotolerans]|uniref:LysR family transcriptional regulator (Chromosome initiation inhibitor) n=1 Tax=Isoptericola halotolerans TaxID=300560 RepID=A0ABX2A134_9MICO|nr:LysR family transcriptional regulator ArgP [Isoptericola halotolerans]NOV96565.1 LysR family transcriptional regulator (chromosome initiation inhibitor) [Isoptericola halotolerans]
MHWDSGQLAALAAVVTEGSFDAAARALHVTPSAVSQRVRALENVTGTVLVQRTRPVAPTAPGRTLLRLARQVELLGAEAAAELGPAPDDGRPVTVPIAVNADSLATWLMPALSAVDDVCFDVHVADQDRTVELLPAGVVMAAVTSQRDPVQGCTSVPLGVTRYRPAVREDLVARWFPEGPTPAALATAPVVVFDRTDDLQDRWLRDVARRAGTTVPRPPRHHVPSTAAYLAAIRAGMGWGMWGPLPRDGARFEVLEPADDVTWLSEDTVDVPLHLQQWKLRSAVLERVTAALRDEAGRALPQATGPDDLARAR